MAVQFRQRTKLSKWISAMWRIGMKTARLLKKTFFMILCACLSRLECCPERNKKKPREGGVLSRRSGEGRREDHLAMPLYLQAESKIFPISSIHAKSAIL